MSWRPSPTGPPSPRLASVKKALKTPPRPGLMVMALRRAILRVCGVAAPKKARSQADATSMLKRQAAGASGSAPPISPVASSMARSYVWR